MAAPGRCSAPTSSGPGTLYVETLARAAEHGVDILELVAAFTPMFGAGPEREVVLWQRVKRPEYLLPAPEPGGAGRAPRPRHLDARRPRGARPLGEPPAPGGSLVAPRLTHSGGPVGPARTPRRRHAGQGRHHRRRPDDDLRRAQHDGEPRSRPGSSVSASGPVSGRCGADPTARRCSRSSTPPARPGSSRCRRPTGSPPRSSSTSSTTATRCSSWSTPSTPPRSRRSATSSPRSARSSCSTARRSTAPVPGTTSSRPARTSSRRRSRTAPAPR